MAILNIHDGAGDFSESHEFTGSLMDWVQSNCPSFDQSIKFDATIDGKPFDYGKRLANETVTLTVRPGWQAVPYIIAFLSAAYSYYQSKKFDNRSYQDNAATGRSIYSPNARANSIVPSGIIREVAGKPTIWPDLICQARRKYIDHQEYLFLMLCVGRGYFDLLSTNIYISETPISNYAGDFTSNIVEPGGDVTGHEAHENWYTSEEVSRLQLTTEAELQAGAWTIDTAGDTITSYLDGVETAFPFEVDATFELTSGSNIGYWRVTAIGSPNSTATVTPLTQVTSVDRRLTTLIPRLGRGGNAGATPSYTRSFTIASQSPTLVTTTGESVDWSAVNGGENWEGPFTLTPVNETARYCEVDISFPQGLSDLDNDNKETNATVEIAIQWRAVGDSTWNTVADTSYTEATYDERGYTVEIDFGSSIYPEMRFRRVTKDSEDIQLADIVEIVRVKCLLETPTSYAGVTTIALRIRGTNALAGTAENKINIRGASRKLPTLAELEAGSWNLSAATTGSTSGLYDIDTPSFSYSEDVDFPVIPSTGPSPALPVTFEISEDGQFLIVGTTAGVSQWTLSTLFDIRTKTNRKAVTLANSIDGYRCIRVVSAYVYYMIGTAAVINRYLLTAPYDASTAYVPSPTVDSSYSAQVSDPQSFDLKSDGTKVYVADGAAQTIYQYTLSTPYGTHTQVYDSVSLDVSSELGSKPIRGIRLADSDARLYVTDDQSNIYSYTMSTAGDLSTASYDSDTSSLWDNPSSPIDNNGDIAVFSGLLYFLASSAESVRVFEIGGYTDSRSTRSIARFVGHNLYEAMGSDSATIVDWDSLGALDTIWEAREDYLDGEFVEETTLHEALKIQLAPGYAEPTIREGQFVPIRTVDGTDYNHLYTPDVMLDDGLQVDHEHYDNQDPDGVEVEYFSLLTNQMETVTCRLSSDPSMPVRPKRIKVIGIVDRDKAWRYGMLERRRLKHKPATYTFSTEMDALNSNYGDPIAIASELFASQCGEVTAYSAPNVTLDFAPTFGAGTHYAAFRDREGAYSGLYTVTQGSPNNVVTITSSPYLDFTPVTDGSMDSTLMSFGNSDQWGTRAICRRISPQGDSIVQVTAEEHISAIYDDIDGTAP